MIDWGCLFMGVLLFLVSARLTVLQAELWELQEGSSKSTPGGKSKPAYKNGDWMVQMKKPKREIVISECFTEGEVVRKIILMGHKTHDIKEITQLWV